MAELPSDMEPQNPESICDLLIEPVHRELAPYCYDTINTTVRNRKPSRRGSHQFKPSRRGTQNQKSNRKPSRRGKVISSSPQDEAHRIKSQIGSPQDEAKSSVRPGEAYNTFQLLVNRTRVVSDQREAWRGITIRFKPKQHTIFFYDGIARIQRILRIVLME